MSLNEPYEERLQEPELQLEHAKRRVKIYVNGKLIAASTRWTPSGTFVVLDEPNQIVNGGNVTMTYTMDET